MASWVSDWYFENGFDINGVEFGHREAELVKEIENNNGADNIGITAIFRADGIVKNPAIYHSESGKYIKVGYTGNDLNCKAANMWLFSRIPERKYISFRRCEPGRN